MNELDNGGPAFPTQEMLDNDTGEHAAWASQGMTLRDYFAAKALQGLLACPDSSDYDSHEDRAQFAYGAAEAMLKAREE